ncbi:hypothetical protein Tco_1278983 [Tanacetum coccineum]
MRKRRGHERWEEDLIGIPQRIDEFDLKDETSLSKCDEKEQNVLYFNDLFHFNVIYPDDSKSDKDNDDDKIDIKQYSGCNVINIDDGAYAQSTDDTTYPLNEYSVFDKGINTAYPGEPSERKDLVDCVFSGILCVLFMLGFRPTLRTHILAHKLNMENLPSKISWEFLILILLNFCF